MDEPRYSVSLLIETHLYDEITYANGDLRFVIGLGAWSKAFSYSMSV